MYPWRDIKFGIEFEADFNDCNRFIPIAVAEGAAHGMVNWDHTHPSREEWNRNPYGQWSTVSDGGGIEVRTPISCFTDWPEIFSMIRLMRESGATMGSTSNGMHVHFDVSELNDESKSKLFMGWASLEPGFFRLMPSWRRESDWCYHSRWHNDIKENYIRGWNAEKRVAFTRGAFGTPRSESKPTFEARIHHGCLEYEDVFSWVTLMQVMMCHWRQLENPVEYLELWWDKSFTDQVAHMQEICKEQLPTGISAIVIANLTNRLNRYN